MTDFHTRIIFLVILTILAFVLLRVNILKLVILYRSTLSMAKISI